MNTPELVEIRQGNQRNIAAIAGFMAGAALVGAVAADITRNRHKERQFSPEPTFHITRNPNSDRTILLLGGCQSHGGLLHKLLMPKLIQFGSVVTPQYPEASFDEEVVSQAVVRKLADEKLKNISPVGLSKGGMLNSRIATNIVRNNTPQQVEEHFGTFGSAVYDGTPRIWGDISERHRKHIKLAQKLCRSDAANSYKRYRMRRQEEDGQSIEFEDAADLPLLEEIREAKINVRLGALAGQGQFMEDFDMASGELEGIYQRVFLLHTPRDPVINPNTSVPGWQEIFGEDAMPVQDPYRPADSHANTPSQPSFVINLLQAEFAAAA